MSDPTPIPPVPVKPWWQSKTVALGALCILVAAPQVLQAWTPILPPKLATALNGTAAALLGAAVIVLRLGSQKRADSLLGGLLAYITDRDGPVDARAVEVLVKQGKDGGA